MTSSMEFLPIQEGKVLYGEPALIDFETKQFARLPADYLLTRMGSQIMGTRRKTTLGPIAIKWKPIAQDARVEAPAPE